MPLQFESSRYQRLESLTPVSSTSSTYRFKTDQSLDFLVEASAPGVFRLCVGGPRATEKPLSTSAARVAALHDLLARDEAVGEAEQAALPTGEPGVRLAQGDMVLELRAEPLRLALYRGEQCVLRSSVDAALPALGVDADDPRAGWTASFELAEGEGVYGLAESLEQLDCRGRTIHSDIPAERALPLAWSPKGWGIYVNSLDPLTHAVGAEAAPGHYVLASAHAYIDLYLFIGEPAEILNQYTQITGRAGQPSLWAMGAWLGQTPGSSTESVLESAAQMRESGFAFDAVTLSGPNVFEINTKLNVEWSERLGDVKALLNGFKALDVKVCAPGFPAVLQSQPMFEELEDKGWLLTDEEGGAFVFDGVAATSGESFGLLDLTHKDVFTFWRDKLRALQDEGVEAVSCDAQLDLPNGVSARNGDADGRLRSVYPMLVKRCLYEAAAWNKVPSEGVVWSRDLFPTGQRLPYQAPVSVPNTFEGLAASIRAALTVGMSGIHAQVHDVGNPEASLETLTPELYLRWLGASVLSANFRFHAHEKLLPSALGDAHETIARQWLDLRYRLIPYVLGVIEDAARTGLPVQRSMVLSFPDDPEAHEYDTQYLLGPALLVAPILHEGTQATVYLPKGDAWWDLRTGHRYEGGTTWTMECGLDTLPVFGREGHMLCLGPTAAHTGEFNSARILDEVWLFGMPIHNPSVMRNKIRVMQMQGSSYAKGLEGLKILPSEGLEVKRRGAEVRISRAR